MSYRVVNYGLSSARLGSLGKSNETDDLDVDVMDDDLSSDSVADSGSDYMIDDDTIGASASSDEEIEQVSDGDDNGSDGSKSDTDNSDDEDTDDDEDYADDEDYEDEIEDGDDSAGTDNDECFMDDSEPFDEDDDRKCFCDDETEYQYALVGKRLFVPTKTSGKIIRVALLTPNHVGCRIFVKILRLWRRVTPTKRKTVELILVDHQVCIYQNFKYL